jgi:hypothetical protein
MDIPSAPSYSDTRRVQQYYILIIFNTKNLEGREDVI